MEPCVVCHHDSNVAWNGTQGTSLCCEGPDGHGGCGKWTHLVPCAGLRVAPEGPYTCTWCRKRRYGKGGKGTRARRETTNTV